MWNIGFWNSDHRHTVNPLLSPTCQGAYLFQAHLSGALIETGDLFNLEKTMVFVLHKEVGYKMEKLKDKKAGGHAAQGSESNLNFQLVNKPSLPDQSTQSFTVVID